MRLPSFWSGMSSVNKAAYLCQTHQAKDFNDACSMLAKMRRRKSRPKPDPVADLEKRRGW